MAIGYQAALYQDFAMAYPQIQTVVIKDFASRGALHSLMCCKAYVEEGCLLLESDLYFERQCIWDLVYDSRPNLVLASQLTEKGDEAFVQYDQNFKLERMSKEKEKLDRCDAVKVHLGKFSRALLDQLQPFEDQAPDQKLDHEDILDQIKTPVFVKKNSYLWAEVDTPHHLDCLLKETLPKINLKEAPRFIPRHRLFTPGPATTTNTVKSAMMVPDICHREQEMTALIKDITSELTAIVSSSSEYDTTLFTGSGTAAVEAMISSLSRKEPLLVINNGAYGKRCVEIAKAYDLSVTELTASCLEPLNLSEIETALKEKEIKALIMVHHETTSGLLNPIKAIGKLCKTYDCLFCIDAMSSFAAVPIDCDQMNIHFLAASSNKNLQGMPGISFVIHHTPTLTQLATQKPKNLYLNLAHQYQAFKKTGQLPFTPAIQVLYALRQAIIELKREGVQARYERYSQNWDTLIEGLKKRGLTFLVDPKHHSKCITTVPFPNDPNFNFDDLHRFCYDRQCSLYPGKIPELNSFRIGTIGAINQDDVNVLLDMIDQYLTCLKSN